MLLSLILGYACSKSFECAPRSRKDGSARLVRLRVNYSYSLVSLSLSFSLFFSLFKLLVRAL